MVHRTRPAALNDAMVWVVSFAAASTASAALAAEFTPASMVPAAVSRRQLPATKTSLRRNSDVLLVGPAAAFIFGCGMRSGMKDGDDGVAGE